MKLLRYYCSTFIVLLIIFSFVHPVSAHVEDPRLDISVERINPGGVVDVRGVAFDYEESVTLVLIGSQPDIPLGEITANLEGEFVYSVALPSDLVEGTYYIRATTSHHWALSPPLTVWGTAIVEGGGQGPRDDDDGLLAPVPTYPPGVVPGGVVPPTVQPLSTTSESASSSNLTAITLVVLLIAGVLVVYGLRIVRKK